MSVVMRVTMSVVMRVTMSVVMRVAMVVLCVMIMRGTVIVCVAVSRAESRLRGAGDQAVTAELTGQLLHHRLPLEPAGEQQHGHQQ